MCTRLRLGLCSVFIIIHQAERKVAQFRGQLRREHPVEHAASVLERELQARDRILAQGIGGVMKCLCRALVEHNKADRAAER